MAGFIFFRARFNKKVKPDVRGWVRPRSAARSGHHETYPPSHKELLMKSLSRFIAGAALVAATSVASAADIVDTAVSAGQFKTLVTALKEASLVDTLKGKGPFTVFAPTDAAFAKLPAGTLDALLKDKEKLAAVLTYHVVPGSVMAAQVKPGQVKTVQGQSLTVTAKGGNVMVDNANVVKTDIRTSNGVIHVIDSVILPK
jgi:uncharacterized surface protein with fasciclin (FAS1) repeats